MVDITTEQKIKNAILWLTALKSGDYKQQIGRLGDVADGFCCWGLGCFLMKLSFDSSDNWSNDLYLYLGFEDRVPTIHPPIVGFNNLADFNDVLKLSFKDIAEHLIIYAKHNFILDVADGIVQHFANDSGLDVQTS